MKQILEQYGKCLRELDILRELIKAPQPSNELKRDIETLEPGSLLDLAKRLIELYMKELRKAE